MAENITTISNPAVLVKPSETFIDYIRENCLPQFGKGEVPENLCNITKDDSVLLGQSDLNWINQFLINQRDEENTSLLKGKELDAEIDKIISSKGQHINIAELHMEKTKNLPYLHNLMKGSELILPKNDIIERNPILAERIERLKKEQEDREYKAMTKNIDMSKKHFPEDSISYQMNMMNRHLIAVGQFLVSVGAGFAFGFLGIELMVGGLNFSVRLLLGIFCALIIAVAEFYFLAKHLNEEDNLDRTQSKVDNVKDIKHNTRKVHQD